MVKSQRASSKAVAERTKASKGKPGRKPKKASPARALPAPSVPPNDLGSAASEETAARPGRRSARLASRQQQLASNELARKQQASERRQELPVSSPAVVKKLSKTAKHSAGKGKASRLSAGGIWQAIQSAPTSVSKMLAPAISPFSNFFGSATQAVSSTFMRMAVPSPAAANESGEQKSIAVMQRQLEGKL